MTTETSAEPEIRLREGWKWQQKYAQRWHAAEIVGNGGCGTSSNGTLWLRGDVPDDVILAVLEANTSPALEEYRERVLAGAGIGAPFDPHAEMVEARDICGRFWPPGYHSTREVYTAIGEHVRAALAGKFGTDQNPRLAARVLEAERERDKLRADLSAALAERNEARKSCALWKASAQCNCDPLQVTGVEMRKAYESLFGLDDAVRVFHIERRSTPADPEGGPTE